MQSSKPRAVSQPKNEGANDRTTGLTNQPTSQLTDSSTSQRSKELKRTIEGMKRRRKELERKEGRKELERKEEGRS